MSRNVCKPVNIPNEFITTLLTPEQKKELRQINQYLTENIINCTCPNLDTTINHLLPQISKPNRKSEKYCDSIISTNTILYGTTICQDLLLLNLSGISNEEIKKLNSKYQVIWPWSLQYNSDRLGNNKRLQYFPLIISFPQSVKEVSFWVGIARKYGLSPSIRSGGHSYEGFCNSGQLIIDTTDLKLECNYGGNFINIEEEYIDVSPGVRLGILYDELVKKDVIIAGGMCPSVCVGGLVAGGGVGYFLRQYGYACDNVLEVDVILATGEKITATADNEYSNLFRSIKGAGGGNFGVITRYRLKTHKVKRVIHFTYSFAGTDTVAVLNALQRVGITAPDNLSGIAGNLVAGIPGIAVNGIYNPVNDKHPIAEFNIIIRSHFFSLMPGVRPIDSTVEYQNWVEIDTKLGFEAPPLPFYKTRSTYSFRLLSLDEIKNIVDSFVVGPSGNGAIFIAMNYLVFGGFVNRVDPDSSVMVARNRTKGWFHMACYYTDPNDISTAVNSINGIYNVIEPLTSIYADPNAPDLELTNPLVSYYGADNVPFLKEVKAKYDPNNLFTFPQSIPINE